MCFALCTNSSRQRAGCAIIILYRCQQTAGEVWGRTVVWSLDFRSVCSIRARPRAKSHTAPRRPGRRYEFAAYPRREQGISRMTLWVEEDGRSGRRRIPMRWYRAGRRAGLNTARPSRRRSRRAVLVLASPSSTADGPRCTAMRGYGGRCEVLGHPGGPLFSSRSTIRSYRPPRLVWAKASPTTSFPDRFCRDRDPGPARGRGRRAARAARELGRSFRSTSPDGHGEILNNDFFGGTLRGVLVQARLPREPACAHAVFQPDLSGVLQPPL